MCKSVRVCVCVCGLCCSSSSSSSVVMLSVCDERQRQCRSPDAADRLSQEETHSVQEADQGHHGIPDVTQLGSWSQVRRSSALNLVQTHLNTSSVLPLHRED